MRRGLVSVAAAILLLPGCHELWGGSSSGAGSATYGPSADEASAQTSVRAAIPAIEAWYADHGTYEGLTVEGLQQAYDAGVQGVVFVEPLNSKTYCVEATAGQATFHKQGPAAEILIGHCGARGAPVVPPPPKSSDPQTNLRNAVPAIEAWWADHGTYAGATLAKLRAQYDYGIPLEVSIVRAGKKSYCAESTAGGDTWSYWGPETGFKHGGC
jgi:hypothetical protein